MEKTCPESLEVKAMPSQNSKAKETKPRDLMTTDKVREPGIRGGDARGSEGEHNTLVEQAGEGAGAGEPVVPLLPALAQSLAEVLAGGREPTVGTKVSRKGQESESL